MKKLALRLDDLSIVCNPGGPSEQTCAALGCPDTNPTACEPGCTTYGHPGGGEFCNGDTIEGDCYTLNLYCG